MVFLTALGRIEQEVKGLEMGAIDYIAKPINPEIVKMRVRNHLELKRHRDTLKTLSLRDGLTPALPTAVPWTSSSTRNGGAPCVTRPGCRC